MTILEVDEIIQKIVDMDLYEIEQIAAERFHINTAYLELEDVVEKLQECLMAEIEESDELLEYIKKEAATDGKYAGEIWDLLSYCKKTQNIEYFITNSAKYGKENIYGDEIVKMLIASKDLEYIDSYMNDDEKLMSLDKVQLLIELDNMNYTKKCIKNRHELKLNISSIIQIIENLDAIEIEDFIEAREIYNFDNDEITHLAIKTQDSEYINQIIKNRKKYALTPYNILELIGEIQIINSSTNQEIIEYYIKEHKDEYNFNTSETSKIISISTDMDFLKSCVRKDYFSKADKMYLALKTGEDSFVDRFLIENKTEPREEKRINLPDNMTIGIEIESEGVQSRFIRELDNIYGEWEHHYDLSIKEGVEVVSPVLSPNNNVEIYKVCDILNTCGQYVTENCGGHVHIGADYLTSAESYQALINILKNAEKLIYIISNKPTEIPRKGIKRFARKTSKKFLEAIHNGEINLETQEDLNEFVEELQNAQKKGEELGNEKYYGIHFRNVKDTSNGKNEKNTIEFRYSNGTLDPDIWIENINLYGSIVKVAEDIANIERKEESEMTRREMKILSAYKVLQMSHEEGFKLEKLLELLFEDEHQRAIYRRRYEKNRFLVLRDKELSSYLDGEEER